MPMGMRLLFHDDDCGEFLGMGGECPRCGFLPDLQSLGIKEASPEELREDLARGRTYLAPDGMKIWGWVEPNMGSS
jgi:hypothetical protein